MRESWTDERLDDFRGEVNRRFDEVYRRFDEVDKRFEKIEGELTAMRADMKAGFERVDEKFERMYRLMFTACVSVIVTVIAASAGVIATQL